MSFRVWATCPIPAVCSCDALAMLVMILLTFSMLSRISAIVRPASSTSLAPSATLPTEAPISCLISFAASALRCARLRTSAATTAKPRPCSPALAASTAALSARMLVWKAMPSMTPVMSPICFELALIEPMVCTTRPTTSPPRPATRAALTASSLACFALSAFWVIVALNSSMVEEVSSSDAACSSVRCERSLLPASSSRAAEAIASLLTCTSPTIRCRLVFMLASAPSSWLVSEVPLTSMRLVRSPAATRPAITTASVSGTVTLREIQTASISDTAIETKVRSSVRLRART